MKVYNFLKSQKFTSLAFFFTGFASLIWFLVRVIPKPSRATYPCMQASAPLMSAFVLYLTGLVSTIFIFRKQKRSLLYSRFTITSLFVVIGLFSFSSSKMESELVLLDESYFQANAPMGQAKGIFPGRVVWVHNPDATNANMANNSTDYWAMDKNCNQALVDSMLTSAIRRIGGKSDVKKAWENVFKYFNNTHGKGLKGYTPGETFAIKINLTNSCCVTKSPTRMDSSPQMVLGILHQLIDVVGVPQSDIWIGDNYREFRDEYYTKCHAVYPDVHYVDGDGGNGREQTQPTDDQILRFSDGQETASLPQHYVDASYFINMPCLKTHNEGAITLCAKNHQGSILHEDDAPQNQSAYYMHYALPANNTGNGHYRHLVDYMGHAEAGGKTLLYIIDGLWAGKSWEGWLEKWAMAPFNNDYPSSIFISQDPVAIESVCYDFLLTEYASKPSTEKYPYISGADDYLRQAADPANWPSGLQYDPEGDGSLLKSLGVYEHWNNPADKNYSRNLGTGTGIELTKYTSLAIDNYTDELSFPLLVEETGTDFSIYPNPITDRLHIETTLNKEVNMQVYDLRGSMVYRKTFTGNYTWNGTGTNGNRLPMGNYILRISEKNSGKIHCNEKILIN